MTLLSKHETMTGEIFHFDGDGCMDPVTAIDRGKSGRAAPKARVHEWRRNGATVTWKTRPDEFRVPVKYGLYGHTQINEQHHAHLASACPSLRVVDDHWRSEQGARTEGSHD